MQYVIFVISLFFLEKIDQSASYQNNAGVYTCKLILKSKSVNILLLNCKYFPEQREMLQVYHLR